VHDGARFIRSSIASVQEDLFIGGILAVLIVLFFLRNGRSTIIAAVALPTSVIGTFALMKALDFTFNNITMLALTLSIGILIDDAIVVIENIVRHLEEGKSPVEAAFEGTKEIALAVFAVTLSLVAVFVPVAFMEGVIGQFFYQFGITVAVAVLLSFAVSLTLTPMMSGKMLRREAAPGRISQGIERFLTGIESWYRKALATMLDNRKWVVVGSVAVLILTFFTAGFLRTTFIPPQDAGSFEVSVETPIGSDLQRTWAEVQNVASQIDGLAGVESVFASAGGGVQEQVNKGSLVVNLLPISERAFAQQDIQQFLRDHLTRPADVLVSVSDFSMVGGGRSQAIQFNLRGADWDEVVESADKVVAAMRAEGGFVDLDTTYRIGKPELAVEIYRDRDATLGIPAASLGETLRTFLGGDKITDYREGGKTYEVRIRLPEHVLADDANLGALTVRAGNGQLVELRNVATIRAVEGPTQIDRQALERQITVLANLEKGKGLGEAMGFLQAFASKELPRTVVTDFDGAGKELGNTAIGFLMALLLGVILVYMILAAQFESLLDPFVIMMSVPFAVIGAFLALLVTGEFFSMFAMIGFIMLMGLVTKNGILLVDFTKQLRARGRSTRDALLEAGPIRLRPILMTTLATIGGMIPPAFASGDGAEIRNGMAVAIIGGLLTSTVLTLGVVPVVYSLLDEGKERLLRRLRGRPELAEAKDAAA
jgi:HAE1 family hydrophobic/amphiphilic exporter-1